MIEFDNRTALQLDIEIISAIADSLTKKEIELIITDAHEMREINKEHRGIDKATDVLSFPYEAMPMIPLGSIVICREYIEQKAIELGHTNDDEFALLFIHGLLHLLGYDHEVDDGEMRQEEARLIQKFNLPESLIVRNEG
ncbi:MAG: rRNA maturation RNase YbeY [Sulfurimonas sp.]|uniref:rRNA maturation RNase YbeY n=1 Tax=Sulfurimonas sp. TaxID=2022749 RepID=UPI003D119853